MFIFAITTFFTLRATNSAGLHVAQQCDEVLNNTKVLRTRGAAGVNGDCHQQLLNVTNYQLIVIGRNPSNTDFK